MVNADTRSDELTRGIFTSGKVPTEIRVILCTYRQGFSLRDTDFVCHLVPTSRIRHSPEDILQVSLRFRNGVRGLLLYANLDSDRLGSPFDEAHVRRTVQRDANNLARKVQKNWADHKGEVGDHATFARFLTARVLDGTYEEDVALLVDGDMRPNPYGVEHRVSRARQAQAYTSWDAMGSALGKLGLRSEHGVPCRSKEYDSDPGGEAGYPPKGQLQELADRFETTFLDPLPESASAVEKDAKAHYLEALMHWEHFLYETWHGHFLWASFHGKKKVFSEVDGNVYQRLNDVYNAVKHTEARIKDGKYPEGSMLPIWLCNEGLSNGEWTLSYEEAAALLVELAEAAQEIEDPRTYMEGLQEDAGDDLRFDAPSPPPTGGSSDRA
jgi:hypothetical protein